MGHQELRKPWPDTTTKTETQNHDHDPTLQAPITTRLTCRWHQKSRKGRNRSPGTEGGANPTGTQTLGCRQAPAMAARITSGNGSGMGDGREWNRTWGIQIQPLQQVARARRNEWDWEWEWNHEHGPTAIAMAGVWARWLAARVCEPTVMGASSPLDVRPSLPPFLNSEAPTKLLPGPSHARS